MMRQTFKSLTGAAVVVAGVTVWGAVPAAAQTVIDEGHLDIEIEVDCDTGDVEFEIDVEDVGHFDPDEVEILVRSAAWDLAGAPEQVVFGSTDVAVIPEVEEEGLVFPGFDLEVDGDCVDTAWVWMWAADVPQDGRVAAYGSGGSPQYFDSDGSGWPLAVSDHTHVRYGFTEPGEYTLHLQAITGVGASSVEAFDFVIEAPAS